MTEWLEGRLGENMREFDERLDVWLMKHPTWSVVFDREVHRLCDLGVEFYLWEEMRARAYWNIHHKYNGRQNQ